MLRPGPWHVAGDPAATRGDPRLSPMTRPRGPSARYDRRAMSVTETIAARDGMPLLLRRWEIAGEPWATMLVVHGLGEHSGRHDATAGRFAGAGIAAVSYDHRGFGASGGRRAYVDRWSQYLDDIADRLAASRRDGLPAAIYGHSLGGLLVADYLLDGRPLPDVAILSSPALGAGVNPALRIAAPILAAIAPRRTLRNPWDASRISREPYLPVVGVADPLSEPRTTLRLGALLFSAMARVHRRLAARHGFPLPVLVVHGGDDRLVPTASTAFLEAYPSVERRVYPGVRHEPHHDPFDGARIVGDQLAWLRDRLAVRTPGLGAGTQPAVDAAATMSPGAGAVPTSGAGAPPAVGGYGGSR